MKKFAFLAPWYRRSYSQVFHRSKGESGQILVLAALVLTVLLGFSALAIDVGSWYNTRTRLQADVDAMALAGAQLCEPTACKTTAVAEAKVYGDKNGLLRSDIEFIRTDSMCEGKCSAASRCDRSAGTFVTVQAKTVKPPLLAQVVGIGNTEIGACSTAIGARLDTYGVGGFGHGVRPFALERKCLEAGPSWPAITYGSSVVLKFDTAGKGTCQTSQGNFAAIAIDGSGASTYSTTIQKGSKSAVCADSTPGCCPNLTSSGCVGTYGVYIVPTETGNMIGPTKTGIDYLLNNTPAACNTWTKVQTNGELNPACIPWATGYTGATRLLIVPIVDGLWGSGGNNLVTIKRFAIVFLDGYNGTCSGNNCDIKARFIKATVSLEMVSAKTPCGKSGQPQCSDITTTVTAGTKLVQ